jgi:4-amino-4-deoxy-L-arabinose transferase-like glycosyltransferase
LARPFELEASGAAARDFGVRGAGRGLAGVLERYAVVVLVLLAAGAFALRAAGLSEVGLAEDEVNKLEAVRAYAVGDITKNAEHPMLMKTLIFVSVGAAGAWNGVAPAALRVSDEAALRLPNVLCGALTVFPLFLLCAALFDRRTALVAAALWATGVAAVTYNRVAKEDTLLVFFMLLAFYFYVRAKQASGFDPPAKRRHYLLSGVSFGLMFASKYFPHYFGLNMLYHHLFKLREREPGEPRGHTPRLFYAAVAVSFLAANPAFLLPETWTYLDAYSSEQLLTHHGYLMDETLYHNTVSKSPFGATPVYFYLLFLLVKTPPVLLAALSVGLYACARRRREPGPAFLLLMFALWVVPYSLIGAKWLRYALSLMPFVYMLAAVGILGAARACRSLGESWRRPAAGGALAAALVVAGVGVPAYAALRAGPHYALYTNALAPGAAGRYFPHDELYDAGLREALEHVARVAPAGATVAHETPGVARYYLARFGRADLNSQIISDPAFDATAAQAPAYLILQRGRTYFENRDELRAVRTGPDFTLEREIHLNGVSAAEIYRKK